MKYIKDHDNIILEDNNKYLMINYGGNLDLYWSIHCKNIINGYSDFVITKVNYEYV